MTDRARIVLNELLGMNRDNLTDTTQAISKDTCVFHLVGICPYMLLQNTKGSIGKCRYRYHENHKLSNIETYEIEYIRLLIEIVLNIEMSKQCKSQTYDIGEGHDLLERIIELEHKFSKAMDIAQDFVSRDRIYEGLIKQKEAIEVKKALERAKEAFYVSHKEVKMDLCPICGVNVVQSDTVEKLSKHTEGKLHKSHLIIRNELARLLDKNNILSLRDFFPGEIVFKYIRAKKIN